MNKEVWFVVSNEKQAFRIPDYSAIEWVSLGYIIIGGPYYDLDRAEYKRREFNMYLNHKKSGRMIADVSRKIRRVGVRNRGYTLNNR